MKTKLFYFFMLLLGLSFQIYGQETARRFDNGITVAVMSKTIPPVTDPNLLTLAPLLEKDFTNAKRMNRSILDTKNKLSYDYSLEVIADEKSDKFTVKFKLETENLLSKAITMMNQTRKEANDSGNKNLKEVMDLSGKIFDEVVPMFQGYQPKSLPKYPDEVVVNDGDTIVLDILQDPKTGAKVQDLIRVTRENKKDGYFVDLEKPRDFSLNDLQMNLEDAQIFINGKLSNPRVAGNLIAFTGKGANVMLVNQEETIVLAPTENQKTKFEKIGTIEDNKLIFTHNGVKYKIVSKVSILGKAGKWNLWGSIQPAVEKAKNLIPASMYPLLSAKDEL